MGLNLGGGPKSQAAGPLSPDFSTFSGVLASVSTIDLNSGAFQALKTVPAGRTMIVDYVILRDTEAMRNMALADTMCGGEKYGTTVASASMRKALATNAVLSTRQLGTARTVEAETIPDEEKIP